MHSSEKPIEKALIVHPELRGHAQHRAEEVGDVDIRSVEAQIQEITSLVKAIELEAAHVEHVKILNIQPSHFIGKGKQEELAALVQALEPNIIIFNHTLSPVQQRNLERSLKCKVIDRTGLILEIFGARAQTKEGRLQVELAALDYQKSRLVRSWTHLERQRGGAGFMGGPGETQIEIDRRLISGRITKLKKQLETVQKTRALGRKSRAKVPFPVVALVGYTNAGKSTLFNKITNSDVFAQDLLFATLDPTLRKIDLPGGQKAILSDTVGFISNLPTHLIAAFRATLEETIHADVILHVMDASSEDQKAQRSDVIKILDELGITYDNNDSIIEVYNKIDAIDDLDRRQDIARHSKFTENAAITSGVTGQGLDQLYEKIAERLNQFSRYEDIALKPEDGKALSWLYGNAEILERQDMESEIALKIQISPENFSKFQSKFLSKS